MSGYNFKKIVFFCLKIFFTVTNSVDPDEMQHYAAFHLGLHCLQSTHLGVSQIQRVNFLISQSKHMLQLRDKNTLTFFTLKNFLYLDL